MENKMKCICGYEDDMSEFYKLDYYGEALSAYLSEPCQGQKRKLGDAKRIVGSLYICPQCGTVKFPIEIKDKLYLI